MTIDDVMKMIHDNEYMRKDDARDKIRAAIEALAAPAAPRAGREMMPTIETRAGVPVLVMSTGARPATDAEVAFFAEAERLRAYIANLAAAPAAPQQADTCPTCGSDCNERDELEKAEREIERLRALPQQAEPVAWMKFGGSVIHTMLKRGRPELYPEHTIPLYLHPPAAEVQRLRDAARAYIDAHYADDGERMETFYAKRAALEALRRALEGGE